MNAASFLFPLTLIWMASGAPVAVAQTPVTLGAQLENELIKLSISGQVGQVYHLESASILAEPTVWIPFDYVKLPLSPYLYIDHRAPTSARRFYRTRTSTVLPVANMVFIPAGTFAMGSPPDEAERFPEEGPQTTVTISHGFWMSKYEVTQAEYLAVAGGNPSDFKSDVHRPVDSVTWLEATDYCAKLTQQERMAGRIPAGNAYRLPTEAEWEYACRAGSSTRFSYGDDPGYISLMDYAWFRGNSDGTTALAGQKLANAWELYDMHGNVTEWCQDRYGPYSGGTAIDPQGPATGSLRVVRGGSYYFFGSLCRSAYRTSLSVVGRYNNVGFRVILAPPQ